MGVLEQGGVTMKIQPKNKRMLLKAALGEIACDLVIKNANMVNVITGEIYLANVYVYAGMIAHVEWEHVADDTRQANFTIDARGKYLIPGLIDAHIHIESSMMTPRNFAKAVIPHGTTTVVTDPHEIANVWGMDGVKYMYENSERLPMRQFIDVPSCVPAAPGVEHSGAEFYAKEVEELASLDRVIGLAEVMDFLAVIQGEDTMMDKIEMAEAKNLYLQGHAPFLSGGMLSAYLCGGPNTCHETRDSKEALEKIRSGMYVDARDSSIAKNIEAIWQGVKDIKFFDHFCFCTDDREADDILKTGHLNDVVRTGIKNGMDPVTAIRSATYNTAREIHLDNLGAIAPGFVADMLLVDSLEELTPSHVIFEGALVAKDGQLIAEIAEESHPLETMNSMFVKELSVNDFILPMPIQNGTVKVNVMQYESVTNIATDLAVLELPVKEGRLVLEDPSLKFVAVVNRHRGHDTIGLGVVKNFGITKGAWATTISHDSHNLTIVYDCPKAALLAANTLINCGGGMAAVSEGKVLYTLELALAGLMSLKPAELLAEENQQMKDAIRALGLTELDNPILRIVTLALPVIPKVKISDLGLVDVLKKEIIPTFAE